MNLNLTIDDLDNVVDMTDSYKLEHHGMELPGTDGAVAYFEARKGAKYERTTFFGLQYLIKKYLLRPVTKADVDKAEMLAMMHEGPDCDFDRSRWDYIVEFHGGKLPVVIEAVPEGTVVPTDNVLLQIFSLDPKCHWLGNHLETIITHVWAGSTIATHSREVKEFLKKELDITCNDGANFGGLPFMLHDFGMRGVSSLESAGVGGLSHLINFQGTDTIIALKYAIVFYGATTAVGYSVKATEHSIMTQRGAEHEREVVQYLLKKYNKGILSMVADSYDYKRFVEQIIGKEFKQLVLDREGKLVVRPDSGDPLELMPWTLNSLGESFGFTVNKKGYKVLNPKVGVIWGDGIDFAMLKQIVQVCREAGWSTENLVFGMGGGLLQKVNRDVQRFAFKACAKRYNGIWNDVWKDPTDKSKISKRGIQKLVKVDGAYKTVRADDPAYASLPNEMKKVYDTGALLIDYTFDQVRENTAKSL